MRGGARLLCSTNYYRIFLFQFLSFAPFFFSSLLARPSRIVFILLLARRALYYKLSMRESIERVWRGREARRVALYILFRSFVRPQASVTYYIPRGFLYIYSTRSRLLTAALSWSLFLKIRVLSSSY